MNAELTLYAISVIGNIGELIALILLLFPIACIILIMVNEKEFKKYLKLILPFLAILLCIGIIIPDRKTMYMIASTHYLKKSDIPSKVLEILNHKLDEIIKENKKG